MTIKKAKKIVHIGKYHPPFQGGIESFMSALMAQQVAEGHKIVAVVHHHKKKYTCVKEFDYGVKVIRVPCLGELAYTPISPSFGYHLYKTIKQEKPDILHVHMPNLSAFWCLFLPLARKIPWVIHWHADVLGSVPDLKIKLLYPLYRIFEIALLKKSTKIIATSYVYMKSSNPLKRFIGKTDVIPLGLFSNNIEHKKTKKGDTSRIIDKRNKVSVKLLMIGRLTYYKGHSVIIDALAKLKQQGECFSLHIVGGGDLFTSIDKQIKDLELTGNVKLMGKISNEELQRQLNNCDLLCLPSIERTEAFGVVLLEAMREGKACLVSDVKGSGMSWVVEDNRTGFIVKHNDIESLVSKLSYISKNIELLDKYGQAGFERFEEMFSIIAISFKLTTLYEQCIEDCNISEPKF